MANNTIKRVWNANKLVSIEDLSGMTFQGENGGHTFEVSGVDDSGSAVSISGTVTAVFLRADNAAISISGSVSSGKAVATLTQNCYTVPGRFLFTIFVTANSQKTAIYSATGNVARTEGTATGSVPPLVTDSIQTGSITASGDVTVGGVVDVVPRRCYATLSSQGWYRAIRFSAINAYDLRGADGSIIDIFLSRIYNYTNNEAHKISLLRTYDNNKFVSEASVSNSLGIDGIRLTVHDGGDGDRYAYIDIHYSLTNENPIAVHFNTYAAKFTTSGNDYTNKWIAESLQAVAASPSGETVLAEYRFTSKAPMGDVSSLITWSTTYVSSSSGMKVYRDGNKLVFSGYLQFVTGVTLQGNVIGTINSSIACVSNSPLFCLYTPSEASLVGKPLDLYILNGTSIRCANNATNSNTNLGGTPQSGNNAKISGVVPLA